MAAVGTRVNFLEYAISNTVINLHGVVVHLRAAFRTNHF